MPSKTKCAVQSKMANDKFSLKWKDFQENMITSLKNIKGNNDLSDVTLVCEEDVQVDAHRIILSACSPFFQRIFKKNIHSHPMIYLRGLKSKDLVAIVDFMYNGEVSVFQDDLDNFLVLAEEFQVKGITGNSSEETNQIPFEKPEETIIKINDHEILSRQPENKTILPTEEMLPAIWMNSTTNSEVVQVGSSEDAEEIIKAMMVRDVKAGEWNCNMCGKAFARSDHMRRHIETNHIEGVSYSCNFCIKVCTSKNALTSHIFNRHKLNQLTDITDNSTVEEMEMFSKKESQTKIDLDFLPRKVETNILPTDNDLGINSSKNSEMDNVNVVELIDKIMKRDEEAGEWNCGKCGKAYARKSHIRQHIEAKHIEGVSYSCNICGHVSRSKHALKGHNSYRHKDNK